MDKLPITAVIGKARFRTGGGEIEAPPPGRKEPRRVSEPLAASCRAGERPGITNHLLLGRRYRITTCAKNEPTTKPAEGWPRRKAKPEG